jgi:ribosome-associated translation inhibitor RaiA
MLVQINTDRNVEGREELSRQVEEKVRGALDRFSDRLTRVEIHLGDENSDKKPGEDDMRCLLEARPAGLRPITVSHRAATVDLAVDGALDKFERALESAFGKLRKH